LWIGLAVFLALVVLVGVGAALGAGGQDEHKAAIVVSSGETVPTTAVPTTTTTAKATATTAKPTTTTAAPTTTTTRPPPTTAAPTTTTAPAPLISPAQANAVRKAESYLRYSAFSYPGLVDQLRFEGFSAADATLAVDVLNVDWNEQAAKKAASYLRYSAFSRSGLFDQLRFEGFTPAEAEFGVDSTGL
jgi:pyruvate/2-oxoglutarate dehydrogenase complex dihydrolipoamide acyltransferase (E2) component